MLQTIATRLSQLRQEKKLSKKKLAEMAGIDYGAYIHYERADRYVPVYALDLLCKTLGTTPNVLMGYDDIDEGERDESNDRIAQ